MGGSSRGAQAAIPPPPSVTVSRGLANLPPIQTQACLGIRCLSFLVLFSRRALFYLGSVLEYYAQEEMWAALVSGAVDAVFIDSATAAWWFSRNRGFMMVHGNAQWTNGLAYGCHPEYGDVLTALNEGLQAFKQTQEYDALCAKYPLVACDRSGATFANVKTEANLEVADHPSRRADIVIGLAANFGEHNYVRNGILAGLDPELIKAVCLHVMVCFCFCGVLWWVWVCTHVSILCACMHVCVFVFVCLCVCVVFVRVCTHGGSECAA